MPINFANAFQEEEATARSECGSCFGALESLGMTQIKQHALKVEN